jgi:hypothetical protein
VTGLTKENECIECYPGSICVSGRVCNADATCLPTDVLDDTNSYPVKAVSDCPAGYYCVGALSDDSQKIECDEGFYCPTGSYEQT